MTPESPEKEVLDTVDDSLSDCIYYRYHQYDRAPQAIRRDAEALCVLQSELRRDEQKHFPSFWLLTFDTKLAACAKSSMPVDGAVGDPTAIPISGWLAGISALIPYAEEEHDVESLAAAWLQAGIAPVAHFKPDDVLRVLTAPWDASPASKEQFVREAMKTQMAREAARAFRRGEKEVAVGLIERMVEEAAKKTLEASSAKDTRIEDLKSRMRTMAERMKKQNSSSASANSQEDG